MSILTFNFHKISIPSVKETIHKRQSFPEIVVYVRAQNKDFFKENENKKEGEEQETLVQKFSFSAFLDIPLPPPISPDLEWEIATGRANKMVRNLVLIWNLKEMGTDLVSKPKFGEYENEKENESESESESESKDEDESEEDSEEEKEEKKVVAKKVIKKEKEEKKVIKKVD